MNDHAYAQATVNRLNALLTSEEVRHDIGRLLAARVVCSGETANHPTIQVRSVDGSDVVGTLGLINGMVGVRADGQGWIAAVVRDDGSVDRFELRG